MDTQQFDNTTGLQQDVNAVMPVVTTQTGPTSDPIPTSVVVTSPPPDHVPLYIGGGAIIVLILFGILFWKLHSLKTTMRARQ